MKYWYLNEKNDNLNVLVTSEIIFDSNFVKCVVFLSFIDFLRLKMLKCAFLLDFLLFFSHFSNLFRYFSMWFEQFYSGVITTAFVAGACYMSYPFNKWDVGRAFRRNYCTPQRCIFWEKWFLILNYNNFPELSCRKEITDLQEISIALPDLMLSPKSEHEFWIKQEFDSFQQ